MRQVVRPLGFLACFTCSSDQVLVGERNVFPDLGTIPVGVPAEQKKDPS